MLVALGLIVVTAAVSGFVGSLFSAGFAYRVLHRVADVLSTSAVGCAPDRE